MGAPRRPRGAADAALGARLRRSREKGGRLPGRARHPPAVSGERRARWAEPVPPPQRPLHRRAHHDGLGAASRAVHLPNAVRQRGRVRDGAAVHRDQLRRPEAARRRRAAGAAGPRSGARDERPCAVPHAAGADPQREPRVPPLPRRHRAAPDPARPARVVPQERAVVGPRGPAREPGPERLAAHVPQDGGRRGHGGDGPEHVSGPGQGVRGDGRRARPRVQDPEHAGRLPPLQHAARGGAAALDRGRSLRPRAAGRVHAPRTRRRAAPHRARHRRGARPLHEGSESGRGRRGRHREAGGPGLRGRLEEEVRVLVVGAGGREHALCWALQRDAPDATLYAAPGNPGTARHGSNLKIPATAVDELAAAVAQHRIDLTVVGPEAPLAAGLVDRLRAAGRAVFGPTQAAARLESSKTFAKDVMRRAGVPTAASQGFTELAPALAYIARHAVPLVVKAPGLAGGKGAVICATRDEAAATARAMLADGRLGDAGREIVIGQFLEGEELSVLALTDGEQVQILPAAQDHKRLGEGDTGPNTGGMGAYCPVSLATEELIERVRREVLVPTLHELARRGATYSGVLYAGLMVSSDGTPYVLEFNCRFGDPETQAIFPGLPPGVSEHLVAIATGNWHPATAVLHPQRAAVTTVLAARGYPDAPEYGVAITLPADLGPDVLVFHAGTARDQAGTLRTAGGRVLSVTGLGGTVGQAARASRTAADRIAFDGKTWRRDIAWRELRRAGAA